MEHSAADYLPERVSLTTLREAVHACRGCSLYERATQAVMGEGLRRSHMMVVGEQPGDSEDRRGRPFVGPAGKLLRHTLETAGIPPGEVYFTNAVKHFKWRPHGKRRLHDRPTHYEIEACRPWLEAELDLVEPELLVVLGASAARALLGASFRVTQHRGEALETELAPYTFATIHPSALLRIPDQDERRAARAAYIEEFRDMWARTTG